MRLREKPERTIRVTVYESSYDPKSGKQRVVGSKSISVYDTTADEVLGVIKAALLVKVTEQ